jgi:hypothetical protein
MESNLENKNISVNEVEEKIDFWHSGWAYLIFFIAIVGFLVAVSRVIKCLL